MLQEQELSFGPYRLQLANEQLWRGKRAIRLTPKAFAVLRYLSEHPGQLVTKDALFEAVWSETVVSDVTLATHVRAIRKALDDDAQTPRFIETVHRRGYRFIAPVHDSEEKESNYSAEQVQTSQELNGRAGAYGVELLAREGLPETETTLPENKPHVIQQPAEQPRVRRFWSRPVWGVVAVVLVVGGMVTIRGVFLPPAPPPKETAFPLPDKPSIAVLPFTNMSGDPAQEYFSDGLTATLITALSKLSGLFVIARHSVFSYKGRPQQITQVARELGVRYVVEGSVQRDDDRVRINVQLIDAITGGHLWAERYDRELTDIFALQDEVTQQIVVALSVSLTVGEQARIVRQTTDNVEAYDAVLRGMAYYFRYTPEAHAQAQQLFERAIQLDPEYANAYVGLGWNHLIAWVYQWSQDPQTLDLPYELAQKAISIDDSLPSPHMLLGYVYLWRDRQHEQAISEGAKAIALAPNWAHAYFLQADILRFVGRPEAENAITLIEHAMRLNPQYPPIYLHVLSGAYMLLGRYEEAVVTEKKLLSRAPENVYAYLTLADANSLLGREHEARTAAAEVLRLNPEFSLETARQSWPYKDLQYVEQSIAALRKAGLK